MENYENENVELEQNADIKAGKKTAIGGMIAGIAGLLIFGLVLGVGAIGAFGRARKLGYKGGFAIAALILGILDIVGWAYAMIVMRTGGLF